VIRQELSCTGACEVTGGSGAVQVGMKTWLVQVFVMSHGSEPMIRQELPCRCACDVTGGSGVVQV